MKAALDEAKKALKKGEIPIGAVLVKSDEIIARGHNSSITLNDSTAHAEIMALRRGGKVLGNYRLAGADLYVTVEPCVMCLGALIHAALRDSSLAPMITGPEQQALFLILPGTKI